MTTVNFAPKTLSEAEFKRIATYIESHVGIKMPPEKRLMMQSRLSARLKALNLDSYQAYIDYVFSESAGPNNDEIIMMIDAMTTNLTEFFREPQHFDFMKSTVLPEFVQQGRNSVKLWSAGCSTGQEPYTLSMVMRDFIDTHHSQLRNYSILATDISTKVLDKASNAVYPLDATKGIPIDILRKHFLKGKNPEKPMVRIKPEIRNRVNFMRLNFMDDDYGFRDNLQIIFCRNVLIYFDKQNQEKVIRKFASYLESGGYLFLGHSETIFGMDLPFKTVAPTVFQKI